MRSCSDIRRVFLSRSSFCLPLRSSVCLSSLRHRALGLAGADREGRAGAGVRAQPGEQRRVPAVDGTIRLGVARQLQGTSVYGWCVCVCVLGYGAYSESAVVLPIMSLYS